VPPTSPWYLVAPTTAPMRRTAIAARSGGYLYAVSFVGVTGVRRSMPAGVGAFLRDVRARSPIPVAAGFGVSRPVIRDALLRLKEAGFVRSQRGSGTIVVRGEAPGKHAYPPIRTVADLLRSYEFRITVETATGSQDVTMDQGTWVFACIPFDPVADAPTGIFAAGPVEVTSPAA